MIGDGGLIFFREGGSLRFEGEKESVVRPPEKVLRGGQSPAREEEEKQSGEFNALINRI